MPLTSYHIIYKSKNFNCYVKVLAFAPFRLSQTRHTSDTAAKGLGYEIFWQHTRVITGFSQSLMPKYKKAFFLSHANYKQISLTVLCGWAEEAIPPRLLASLPVCSALILSCCSFSTSLPSPSESAVFLDLDLGGEKARVLELSLMDWSPLSTHAQWLHFLTSISL